MKRLLLAFLLLFSSILDFGQVNNVTTGTLTLGQRISANGATTVVSSGPIYDTTNLGLAGGTGIAAHINYCQTLAPAICDATAETTQTTLANIVISNSGVTVAMPPATITIGSGFFLSVASTATNSGFVCGGAPRSCILQEYQASTNAVILLGTGDFFIGFQTLGGRCSATAVCLSTGMGGTPNTENAVTASGNDHQILNNLITDSGHVGVNLSSCNYCIVENNEIDGSGWEAVMVNPANMSPPPQTSYQNQILNNLVQNSQATNSQTQGQIGIACTFTGCVGGTTDGTLVQGNTVRNDTPACNGNLTTGATGCKEGIQSTDKAYHTTYIGNHVYNSYLEGIVCGGIGCVVTGNTCDTCGLNGGGGIMWSYGGSGSTAGDAVYANNVITNSSPSKTLLYCGSVESTNSSSVTYENIKFANNICSGFLSGASPGFTNGFRYVNTGSGTVTLSDVDFIGNTANDSITTPFKFTYTRTTGVVAMESDVPMPTPTYSSGFSTGVPTIFGGYPSFTVTIGTTPSSSGTLTMPITALTGWTISCVDASLTTGGGFYIKETANTTTSVTVAGYNNSLASAAFTAGDVLQCQAAPF